MLLESDSNAKLSLELPREWTPIQRDIANPNNPCADLIDDFCATVQSDNFVTVRNEEGAWNFISAGVELKLLHIDTIGNKSYLLRMQPDGMLPSHYHTVDEECLVLAGEVNLGGSIARAGDYHFAARGTTHCVLSTADGALLFVRSA